MSYSHMGTPTLPSALSSFTSEFEMGSGGTYSLRSSGKLMRSTSLVDGVDFLGRTNGANFGVLALDLSASVEMTEG
jgi:hypothetical protein